MQNYTRLKKKNNKKTQLCAGISRRPGSVGGRWCKGWDECNATQLRGALTSPRCPRAGWLGSPSGLYGGSPRCCCCRCSWADTRPPGGHKSWTPSELDLETHQRRRNTSQSEWKHPTSFQKDVRHAFWNISRQAMLGFLIFSIFSLLTLNECLMFRRTSIEHSRKWHKRQQN